MLFGKNYSSAPVHRQLWTLTPFQRAVESRGHGRGAARKSARAKIAQNYTSGWVRAREGWCLHQQMLSVDKIWNSNYITQIAVNSIVDDTVQLCKYEKFLEKGTVNNIQNYFYFKNKNKTTTTKTERKKKRIQFMLQIFKIGAGAQFNIFPLRQYRWRLARTLTW